MTTASSPHVLPERTPEVGELVHVRSRRWLVEQVVPAPGPKQSAVVSLSCADDDAQGQALDVFWDCELDRRILRVRNRPFRGRTDKPSTSRTSRRRRS